MLMNADICEIRKATDRLNELLYKEEMMWLQRSRITWLKEGDRNTKYFQSKAVWRARKNKIREVTDSIEVVHSDFAAASKIANEYFHNIFMADPNIEPSQVVNLVAPVISEEDNIKLYAPFSEKEISYALFQIGPLKSPGPDGFPAQFFQ